MITKLTLKNRSYRRFDESFEIDTNTLKEMLDNVRLVASAKNGQPLKYGIVTDKETCHQLTANSGWAGYLTDWKGPQAGERPTAYIIVLGDHSISNNFAIDAGIAMQTILLDAVERGLGGCMIATFKLNEVTTLLQIEEPLKPIYLIALGKPSEEVVVDEVVDGNIKYWRDDSDIHHVPKRSLEEVLLFSK